MIETSLENFGLTHKEIKVYLAALKLKSATVQEIAEKAGSERTYTYQILKLLKEKGLVSYTIRSGKKFFEATNPKKLLEISKERQQEIEKAMPELEEIYQSSVKKPVIEIYDKKEGIKTILQKLLQSGKKEYLGIGNHTKFEEYFNFYADVFVKRRIENEISSKLILEKSKETDKLSKTNKEELRELKVFKDLENTKSEIWTYGDKTILFTLVENEPIGIEIENKEIAELLKIIFGMLWKTKNINKTSS